MEEELLRWEGGETEEEDTGWWERTETEEVTWRETLKGEEQEREDAVVRRREDRKRRCREVVTFPPVVEEFPPWVRKDEAQQEQEGRLCRGRPRWATAVSVWLEGDKEEEEFFSPPGQDSGGTSAAGFLYREPCS